MNPLLLYLHLHPSGGAYVSLGVQSRKWTQLIPSILPFVFDNLTMKSSRALMWMLGFECEVASIGARIWTLGSQQLVMCGKLWEVEPCWREYVIQGEP